jgi:hypothetical protein
MIQPLEVFFEVPCLTERSPLLSGTSLQKKWFRTADRRYIGQYLQKFLDYNINLFDFLGVQPLIIGTDQNTSLGFRTTEFIGAIPLRSSDTGKQIGDFVVSPKYSRKDKFADYIEILNLLQTNISPQIQDSLPLASGRNFRPPLYLEAIKFIAAMEALVKNNWKKFDTAEKMTSQPIGQINWNKYINYEHLVQKRLKFPVKKNVLSEYHTEYSKLRFVFNICKFEIVSTKTPSKIKNALKSRLEFLEERLYDHKPIMTDSIVLRSHDNAIVKQCKIQANRILKSQLIDSVAWRVNFSDVFEKFVQHIFKQVALATGGQLFSNRKFFSRSSGHFSWELKHIEPDAFYQKNELVVFIDAKYKSNLYNKFDHSESLKTEHRYDLHQILAYSSFSQSQSKYCFLCYPSNNVEVKKSTFVNTTNETSNTVIICGIPLKADIINEAKSFIASEINQIEKAFIAR